MSGEVHYEVERSGPNGWNLEATTRYLESARAIAEGTSKEGTKVRIREIDGLGLVKIVEIMEPVEPMEMSERPLQKRIIQIERAQAEIHGEIGGLEDQLDELQAELERLQARLAARLQT